MVQNYILYIIQYAPYLKLEVAREIAYDPIESIYPVFPMHILHDVVCFLKLRNYACTSVICKSNR